MKKLYSIILAVSVMAVVMGCAEKYPVYNEPQDKIYFDYGNQGSDSVMVFSFLNHEGDEATVFVPVRLLGFMSDKSRRISFEQVKTGEDDAVPGTHYVPFTEESAASLMLMPANQVIAKVPITLKRDTSLKEKSYKLRIKIKENNEFGLGVYSNREFTLFFSDMLAKPTYWNFFADYYLGQWSQTRHKFIEESLNCVVDNDWLKQLGADPTLDGGYDPNYDSGYASYIVSKLAAKLAELNAKRAEQGLEPLSDEYGPIEFY